MGQLGLAVDSMLSPEGIHVLDRPPHCRGVKTGVYFFCYNFCDFNSIDQLPSRIGMIIHQHANNPICR